MLLAPLQTVSFRLLAALLIAALLAPLAEQAHGQPATPATLAAPAAPDAAEKLTLETSDGVTVAAWYYPIPKDARPIGAVILVHDLGGSHRTVEPLAKALQAAGCVVVAPDVRGHGESRVATLPDGQDDQSKLLKKPDFDQIAASRGGRMRDQSGVYGDIESARNWLKKQMAVAGIPKDTPLFVVGSGLGAMLAANWTAADAMWPDLASGPQGREVAGLVMISPSFATKGYSLAPALANEFVKRAVPVLLIAGATDRDAIKVFDQIKRQRPREWFDNRHPHQPAGGKDKDASPCEAAEASLMILVSQADRSGDALASLRSADARARAGDPSALITGFMRLAATKNP
jgi:alpha-beta hydrolase superfamily lysophospholipase